MEPTRQVMRLYTTHDLNEYAPWEFIPCQDIDEGNSTLLIVPANLVEFDMYFAPEDIVLYHVRKEDIIEYHD